jgi:8-amino-7-oxononanoate synthase
MLPQRIEHSLLNLAESAARRERHCILQRFDERVTLAHQTAISFCSNDYLNLATHPDVKNAAIEAIQAYGTSSSGSAMVSGYIEPHQALENAFADFLDCDACVLFPSGYHANLAILSTFADPSSVVIADKYIHASLIDGILLSQATLARFPHQQYQQAQRLLEKHAAQEKWLVTESVFSMEGDITDVNALSLLAKKYQTPFIIDHAHGIGTVDFTLTQQDYALLCIPLGKALASQGAIVAGRRKWIEPLLQLARTYRYTTALNPAASAAALAALNIIKQDGQRHAELIKRIQFFIQYAKQLGLPLISDALTPIKSILIGDNQQTLDLQSKLAIRGFFVSCIRPPTVPKNTARIRITLTAAHTDRQIKQLLDTLAEFLHESA